MMVKPPPSARNEIGRWLSVRLDRYMERWRRRRRRPEKDVTSENGWLFGGVGKGVESGTFRRKDGS